MWRWAWVCHHKDWTPCRWAPHLLFNMYVVSVRGEQGRGNTIPVWRCALNIHQPLQCIWNSRPKSRWATRWSLINITQKELQCKLPRFKVRLALEYAEGMIQAVDCKGAGWPIWSGYIGAWSPVAMDKAQLIETLLDGRTSSFPRKRDLHLALTRILAWAGNLSSPHHSRTHLPCHPGSCRGLHTVSLSRDTREFNGLAWWLGFFKPSEGCWCAVSLYESLNFSNMPTARTQNTNGW